MDYIEGVKRGIKFEKSDILSLKEKGVDDTNNFSPSD